MYCTYCRMLNFRESFITRVSWGSLESQKQNSQNIMLTYENRTPDVTLAKLKHHERQTYPNRKLNCSWTLYSTLHKNCQPTQSMQLTLAHRCYSQCTISSFWFKSDLDKGHCTPRSTRLGLWIMSTFHILETLVLTTEPPSVQGWILVKHLQKP